jgi:hypothetical protein
MREKAKPKREFAYIYADTEGGFAVSTAGFVTDSDLELTFSRGFLLQIATRLTAMAANTKVPDDE